MPKSRNNRKKKPAKKQARKAAQPKQINAVQPVIAQSTPPVPDTPAVNSLKSESIGVILVALGHPFYGEMAANLAASIKFNSKVPIHVVHSEKSLSHLTPDKLRLFDSKSLCPKAYHTRGANSQAYFKAKTHLFELSPFDHTIFLDVDMLWFGKNDIRGKFKELEPVDLAIENNGSSDINKASKDYLWADPEEIKRQYNLSDGKLYELHSEFIYFRKSEKMRQFFSAVREAYDAPKIQPKAFAGDMADELAFAIAMLLTGVEPHKSPYLPIYWPKRDRAKAWGLQAAMKLYDGYSVGGNTLPEQMRNDYNNMARAYARGMNVQHPWRLLPKKQFLNERIHM